MVFRKGRPAGVEPGERAGARAEVPLPPAKDDRVIEAEELVRYFHRVFHGSEEAMPTSKALDQAASLVARLGFEKAKHVVDFAHAEAPKTRHRVATFGGVIQYMAPALRDFEQKQEEQGRRRKAQAAIDAQRRQRAETEARDQAARVEAKRYWEALSTAERGALEQAAFAAADPWILSQHHRCRRSGPEEQAEKWRWLIIEAHISAAREGQPA